MQGRVTFVEDLLENMETMINSIEEREVIEPDFNIIRELAEQLRGEIEALE
jgi:hypothetical protein